MVQIGVRNNKIQTIGNKFTNGLTLGNKLFNIGQNISKLNNHSTPIENHSSNSQASIHEPTGIHHSSKNKNKKSYLEKKY